MKTYTVTEAAKLAYCHPETLREYIRAGKLVAAKIGRAYCIRQAKLDEFLQSLENDVVQTSLQQRSEQQCQKSKVKTRVSTRETAFGILTSEQAISELDALLAPATRRKLKRTEYS